MCERACVCMCGCVGVWWCVCVCVIAAVYSATSSTFAGRMRCFFLFYPPSYPTLELKLLHHPPFPFATLRGALARVQLSIWALRPVGVAAMAFVR